MTIWIKLKILAPYDSVSNSGTKYQTIDGKRTLINPDGNDAFSIRKGRFLPIDYDWEPTFKKDKESGEKVMVRKGLEEAEKRFDPAIFEFFKSQSKALEKCDKEKELLKMLPYERMEAKNKRVRDKVTKSKFGQKRPTHEDFMKEANKIGADVSAIKQNL